MTSRLRLVFAGTPEFAVPCLDACLELAQGALVDVAAVYTQPDRPAGRGRKLTPSPVKQRALEAGIPVEQPETLRDADAQRRLADYAPDLMIVVAYGLILPKKVLAIPRLGCWNVHASLLPRWRGAAPIQRAILAGDAETGVDLMQMEAGLDTGPILVERRTSLDARENAETLHDKLATLGADALTDGLTRVLAGQTLVATAQTAQGVEYAHKIEKAEARLDWREPALVLARKVHAFNPWPVAEGEIDGERLRIWNAEAIAGDAGAPAGTVVEGPRDALDVATGDGILRLIEVQREGGRRMSARDFKNARRDRGAAS